MAGYASTDPNFGLSDAPSYASTDPNFGITPERSYASKDPSFGLDQQAPSAPGLDLAGENQVRAKLGYSQLPPEGSPEYQAELDKASGGHVTDSQAMQSLEQDIINRRSNSPEWLQPIEHSLKANLVPIGAHPEKLIEGAVPVVEAYQDAKRLFTDPKSFLGPTATSGKFSPVDLSQQQNLDELVGHVFGGAPAVHGVRTGLAARKGTVEAPTAPPERQSAQRATETPIGVFKDQGDGTFAATFPSESEANHWIDQNKANLSMNRVTTVGGETTVTIRPKQEHPAPTEAAPNPAPIGITDTLAELTRRNAPEPPLPYREQPAKVPVADEQARQIAESADSTTPGDSVPGQQPPPLPEQARVGRPGTSEAGAGERPDSIGVAERYVEEQQPGTVVPGTREDAAYWRGRGADYINAGGDPRMPIRAAGAGHTSPYNVGIVSAEYARLEQLRRNAGAALEERPNEPALQKQYDETAQATQAWRREMQPVLTKAGESLAAIQGEMPVDLSTFDGLHAKAMELNGGHELTPGQKAQLMKRAGTAKKIKAYETDAVARRDAVIDKTLPKVKAPTEADMAAMVDKMVKRMTPCR